jgi:hypothetical protein
MENLKFQTIFNTFISNNRLLFYHASFYFKSMYMSSTITLPEGLPQLSKV